MADIKIDEAKAMAWVSDVKTEIDAVRLLLEEVRRSTENSVDSEDSILQMIRCVGEKMNDVWSNTCKAFKDGYDTLENGLSKFKQAGKIIHDAISNVQKTV